MWQIDRAGADGELCRRRWGQCGAGCGRGARAAALALALDLAAETADARGQAERPRPCTCWRAGRGSQDLAAMLACFPAARCATDLADGQGKTALEVLNERACHGADRFSMMCFLPSYRKPSHPKRWRRSR